MNKLIEADTLKAAIKLFCKVNNIHPDTETFSATDFINLINIMPQPWVSIKTVKPKTGAHVLIVVKWDDDDYEVMEEDWGILKHMVEKDICTPLQKQIYEQTVAWMPVPEYKEPKW